MTQIGTVLVSRYQLGDRIAVGGAGEVWQAVDVTLDRPVAVKLLRAEYAQHPETLARFRSEARHAASLTHPGIAQIFDYYDNGPDHLPFLVMELVDGPSLADVLTRGPLAPADVMDIIAQAAAGLDAAHRSGLVHRDIKPANLLITPAGVVKITDFGIAHAAGSAPVTRQGTLIGTPAYLAPERVAGQPGTPASDLYSLGILAYECLTGARPYAGTPTEIALAHGQRALPPLPGHIPAAVVSFVADLTARDPADRPASARLASARAARLRDGLTAERRPRHGYAPHEDPALAATAIEHPATLADMSPIWHAQASGAMAADVQTWDHGWSRRRVALAVGAAAVVAGLIGWGVSSATSPSPAPTPSTPAAAATSHSAVTVAVQANALVGQPVNAVYQQLQSLGLRPVIIWEQGGQQGDGSQPSGYNPSPGYTQSGYTQSGYTPPSGQGTVVSVYPNGQVPVGQVVTIYAVPSKHGGDGQPSGGDGHGNGNGNN